MRAALLDEKRARQAWAAWLAELADSPLDEASSRLLPLLHRRLAGRRPMLGGSSPRMAEAIVVRAAAAFAQTRYRNALLFEEAASAIRALAEAGIRTCLLKGAALAVTAYDEPALRPMSDVDLLVPALDLGRAAEALRRAGWCTPSPLGPAEMAEAHAAAFTNDTRGSIDLHWRSLDAAVAPLGDDSLWAASQPAVFASESSRVPAPADLLLHACVVGQRWGRDVACRWAADALAILTTAPHGLDWARLESEARRQLVCAAVADALEYLRTVLGAPVPAEVPARLAAVRVSRAQDLAARARQRPPELRGPVLAAALHYDSYRRLVDGGVLPIGPLGFARAVARTWGLPFVWLVPIHALGRGIRRLAQLGCSWWLRHADSRDPRPQIRIETHGHSLQQP